MTRLRAFSGETFRSLRIRNFRLFFVGQLVSQIGNWLTMVALALLVLDITDSGVAIGVVTACQFLPVLLLGVWGGVIADRSDKRRLLIIVQSFAMAQSFALAALAFMDDPPLIALYLVALAGGFTLVFDNPARRAFVTEMVPLDYVPNAVGLNSAVMTGARVVGPALAGLLITTVGYGWTFALDGITYIAVITAYLMMRPAEIRRSPRVAPAKGQVREGLRYVATMPVLWIPLVMLTLIGTFAFNFQVLLPLLVTRTFDSNDAMYTVLFSFLSIGSLIGALWTARMRDLGVRFLVLCATAFGISMLALSIAPSLVWAFVIGIAIGWSSVGCVTGSNSLVQLRADPSMRGRVLALQAIVFLGSTPIGGPIMGWVCEHFGARVGVALAGFVCLFAAALGTVAARRARVFTEPAPTDAAPSPSTLQVA